MRKWYENQGAERDVVVASRIRILRNLKDYRFPAKLSDEERKELSNLLVERMNGLPFAEEQGYDVCSLNEFSTTHKQALNERQIINSAALHAKSDVELLVSKDESVSLTFNCSDHIRMQVCKSGLELKQALSEINAMDDFVNEHFEYAFDTKLGYMTAFPTNVGTGMQVYVILHLPLLSASKRFREIINEVNRYGVNIKAALPEEQENSGSLFVLYNQKTLGISEEDIILIITKVAMQLVSQERSLRGLWIQNQKLQVENICYKAYGNLRYARMLSLKEAMQFLSQLRWGNEEGVIEFADPFHCYELMLGVQPGNLSVFWEKEMDADEMNRARAEYVRRFLPELAENIE